MLIMIARHVDRVHRMEEDELLEIGQTYMYTPVGLSCST